MSEIIKTALLDRSMKEVFDWSDSETPVRDALWDYFMEKNGRSTDKTEQAMLPFLSESDDKIIAFVNENLKK
ncbi:Putative uncharacterized protein [Lactobacillus equicursoris DSM 19284 = JCM 14600 = CIP 110162]|uniref:Uncharacterized protein n=3 Tax=Lactobacillus equicursoris TaxID=420645 RepID=K0NQP5_9LACO|nr:hypothetical protein [Lactobacillus equicursoris]MDD6385927.1 hypothetical protein [Lactobacillus equicursoris]MDD6406533.1 hypothetical protein [Lactobacillus equicursoris]MST80053.1 hypothetical protein [Lactobacillus equicursoris]CCK83278.1 Putative uncharacterized protein [Lactobacillus equicursoris 66c]CCK85396.1 Putative uncharacterized protein [Lactobacillus equicursoris DSM 19284 = JCM 14600 = CIP 110162]